jgi:hypothetical protein
VVSMSVGTECVEPMGWRLGSLVAEGGGSAGRWTPRARVTVPADQPDLLSYHGAGEGASSNKQGGEGVGRGCSSLGGAKWSQA